MKARTMRRDAIATTDSGLSHSGQIRRVFDSEFVAVGFLLTLVFVVWFRGFEYLSHDDLFFKHTDAGTYALALANAANGRFIAGGALYLLSALGIEFQDCDAVFRIFAYLSFTTFAFVFIKILKQRSSQTSTVIYSSIIVLFPYNTSFLINSNHLINIIILFLSLIVAMNCYLSRSLFLRIFATAACLLIAIATYQTAVHYFIVFVCAYQLFNGNNFREVFSGLWIGAAACLVAALSYLLLYGILLEPVQSMLAAFGNDALIEHYGKTRSGLRDLSGFADALLRNFSAIVRVVLVPEPILPALLKLFAGVILLSAFLYWSIVSFTVRTAEPQRRQDNRRRLAVAVPMVLLIGSPIQLFLAYDVVLPRIIMHASAVLAVLFLAFSHSLPFRWRRVVHACAAIYAVGVGVTTMGLSESIYRVYQRDLTTAEGIVSGLVSDPSYDPKKPLAVIGRIARSSSYMAGSIIYFRMNVSKFNNDWSKYEILEEASGQRFVRANDTFLQSAKSFCDSGNPSNAHYTSAVVEAGAIVCLREGRGEVYPDRPRRQ